MTSDPSTDDGVLTPDDLRLDDDRVDDLGDNRYLVRSDRSVPASGPAPSETLPAVDMEANANVDANGGKAVNPDTDTSSSDSSVNPFDFPLADVDVDADHGLESVPGSRESDTATESSEPEPASEPHGPTTAPEPSGSETTPEPRGSDTTAETHPLESTPAPHGIDITLKTDGELANLQTTSNDVREVFAEMLTWYADQLDDDLSPAQVLEVMLATTDLEA